MRTQDIFLYVTLGIVASIAFPVRFDQTKVQYHKPSIVEPFSEKYNSTIYCAICEFLINHGEEYITKNTTEQDAINFLEHVCSRLPKSYQDECDEFVQDNYSKLIEFIIEKESAQTVCTQLHFCDEVDHKISECDFCKYASHRIENFLSNNNTLTDIIEFGTMFCKNYPTKYKGLCNNVVPYYYSQIVGKLIEQNNFVDVCNSLALCH